MSKNLRFLAIGDTLPTLDRIGLLTRRIKQWFASHESYDFKKLSLSHRTPSLEPFIFRDPQYTVYYAERFTGPIPEAAEAVKHDPYSSYMYAMYVVQGPFPEGEDTISQSARYSAAYARLVGVLPKGEKVISQDAEAASDYLEFLKTHNLQPAHPELFQHYVKDASNPKTASRQLNTDSTDSDRVVDILDIAAKVYTLGLMSTKRLIPLLRKSPRVAYLFVESLKRPVPALEDIIAQSLRTSWLYARYILAPNGINRFEAGEPAIATGGLESLGYAVGLLHGPFPEGEKTISEHNSITKDYLEFLDSIGESPAHPELFQHYVKDASNPKTASKHLEVMTTDERRVVDIWDITAKAYKNRLISLGKVIPILSRSPIKAYFFVASFGRPVPELEDVVASGLRASWLYARYILKPKGVNRFEKGEPTIAQGGQESVQYAKEVLGDVFPLGERVISTSQRYSKEYLEFLESIGKEPAHPELFKDYGKQASLRPDRRAALNPEQWAVCGSTCDGLEVVDKIPNTESIASTLLDYTVLKGVRSIPLSLFDAKPTDMFYSKDDIDQVQGLAEQIKQNKLIKPLIVVVDSEGPYVLEGAHRLSALYLLGKTRVPALVVIDETSQEDKAGITASYLGKTASRKLNIVAERLWTVVAHLVRHKMVSQQRITPLALRGPYASYCYATDIIQGRWEEGESVIAKTPQWAYYYALDVLQPAGIPRFELGEPTISKHPQWAFEYALWVLQPAGIPRFELAEPLLAKDPKWAYYYARDVLKPAGLSWESIGYDREGNKTSSLNKTASKSLTLESNKIWKIIRTARHAKLLSMKRLDATLTKSPRLSYFYAAYVLEGEYEAGEAILAKHPAWAVEYAQRVLKGRFIKAEPVLATDPKWAVEYSEVIKGRFIEGEPAILSDATARINYKVRVLKPLGLTLEAIGYNNQTKTASRELYFNGGPLKLWEVVASTLRNGLISRRKLGPLLQKSPQYAYYYAETVGRRVEELEPTIATDAKYSYFYTQDVLKDSFELAEKTISSDPRWGETYINYLRMNDLKPSHPELFRGFGKQAATLSYRKRAYVEQELMDLKRAIDVSEADKGYQFIESNPMDFQEWVESGKASEDYEELFTDPEWAYNNDLYTVINEDDAEHFASDAPIEPTDAPPSYFMTYVGIVKDQWLLHFTSPSKAQDIARNGFKVGVSLYDYHMLGLSTRYKDEAKTGGFNFAFTLDDYLKSQNDYGSSVVIFKASGIRVWHGGDNEYQTIFIGASAHDIVVPYVDNNTSEYVIQGNKGQRLVSSDDFSVLIGWLEKNYPQYKNQITNKPGQRILSPAR